ncbi:hypothetical protein [Diaphorobacter ruginosibacter]|uniref:hypothetical protein n=1 Tax=Diaphorobacter ruginosibacter TaxID=1715720 RepID=UPI003341E167
MRSALIELTSLTQPFHSVTHWLARRAGNDSVVHESTTAIDISELKLLVRPRLAKARSLRASASNSDNMAGTRAPASRTLITPPEAPQRPALRVVVKPDASGMGRMVISGRMADVCAELDRLDRQERQRRHAQPCA